MRKTKFWLIQILMVAIVSLVLGSPVWADDDGDDDDDNDGKRWHQQWKHGDDDDAFNDDKWHKKWNKKQDKKLARYNKRLARLATYSNHNQKWQARLDRKFTKWQARHDRKLARHEAKYHPSDPVVEPVVEEEPTPPEEPTSPEEPIPPTCEDLGLSGTFPNCS